MPSPTTTNNHPLHLFALLCNSPEEILRTRGEARESGFPVETEFLWRFYGRAGIRVLRSPQRLVFVTLLHGMGWQPVPATDPPRVGDIYVVASAHGNNVVQVGAVAKVMTGASPGGAFYTVAPDGEYPRAVRRTMNDVSYWLRPPIGGG